MPQDTQIVLKPGVCKKRFRRSGGLFSNKVTHLSVLDTRIRRWKTQRCSMSPRYIGHRPILKSPQRANSMRHFLTSAPCIFLSFSLLFLVFAIRCKYRHNPASKVSILRFFNEVFWSLPSGELCAILRMMGWDPLSSQCTSAANATSIAVGVKLI